jgi:Zn-dependent protease with chaperone function
MEETFYEARRRHRRAGWRFAALTLVAATVTSLPVALVVSPPLAALTLVAGDLASVVLPVPDLTADVANVLAHILTADTIGGGTGWPAPYGPLTVGQVVTVVSLALVPGLLVVLAAWLVVRRMFLRSGPEAVVVAAGARPPRAGDLEEQQLVNLVEETALAAGVPPPSVRILDTEVANAAIVGRSIDDATVVVPRRLLDQLGRRPTGAVVADLIASAVNGDLRIALSIASTSQTIDLLSGALAAPTSRRARRTLRGLVRLALRRRGAAGDDTTRHREARFIVEELGALAQLEDLDGEDRPDDWRVLLSVPGMVARVALAMLRLIVVGMLVSPAMAMLWRRRRLLADATAVELTRDPDALVAALEHLHARGASVPAGPWSHLFVVGPELERNRRRRRYEEQYDAAAGESRRPGESELAAFARRHRARRRARAEYMQATRAATGAPDLDMNLVAFLPSVETRLRRLAVMGGTRATATPRRRRLDGLMPIEVVAYGLRFAVLSPIVAALLTVVLVLVVGLALLAAGFELAVLAPLVALVHALAR